jgi:2-keto-4-pentenoate hydratase
MTEDAVQRGAAQLLEARRAVRTLAGLHEAHRPRSLAEAYRMQQAFMAGWQDRLVGWKVGATSKEVQDLFGVDEPVYGPVFGKDVFRSPARQKATAFQHLMLESEFAFSFRETLPLRAAPYTREEVAAAIDTVLPAFEIISPRFPRITFDQLLPFVADCSGNGGAVLGAPCKDWRALDLAALPVRLSIAGVERQAGTGAIVLGNPLNVVQWLVNALGAQATTIAKGQFVLTGTMTGIHAPKPGETAVADFGTLGTVEIVFD